MFQYFYYVENYCNTNIKGNKNYWIDELETKLTGDPLKAYKALKTKNDYSLIKSKLLEWYGDTKELRKKHAKNEFEKMKPRKGESLYLYSTRLESAFIRAHPKRDYESSNILRDKFIETIPKECRALFSSRLFSKKIKGKKLIWNEIQRCAMVKDIESKHDVFRSDNSDDENVKEIEINFNQNYNRSRPTLRKTFFRSNDNKNTDILKNNERDGQPTFSAKRNYQHKPAGDYWSADKTKKFNYSDKNNNQRSNMGNLRPPNIPKCDKCGRFGHIFRNCRTVGPCFICNKFGHIKRDCWHNNESRQRSLSQPPRRKEYHSGEYNPKGQYTRPRSPSQFQNRTNWSKTGSTNKNEIDRKPLLNEEAL